MPSIYGNCDIEVAPPICNPCANVELGGVRGIAFIHKDAVDKILATPSASIQWALLIDQKQIFIIPETRGTFNGGEIITQPGFGNLATQKVGFNFSIEYDDPGYKDNCAFYNLIMQTNAYHIAFITETQIKISSVTVSITPTAPITEDITEQAVWHIVVDWQDKLQPCPSPMPDDVFKCVPSDLPPTQIFSQDLHPYLSGAESSAWQGQDVDLCSLKLSAIVGNAVIDGGNITFISNGGAMAFLMSEPYDAVQTVMPRAREMNTFYIAEYFGSGSGDVMTTDIKAHGLCTVPENIIPNNPTIDCDCPQAISAQDYLENVLVNYLLPGKTYYFGVFAKGKDMAGAYSAQLLEATIPPAESMIDPCPRGIQFTSIFEFTSKPWVNP